MRAVTGVAAERLVPAVAGQYDLHVLGGELGDAERGDRGGIPERFVEIICKHGQQIEGIEANDLFSVDRAVPLSDSSRIWEFIEGLILETDRKGSDRFGGGFGHEGGHDARVHPATQEYSDRNVASQSQSNRLADESQALVLIFADVSPRLQFVVGRPVPADRWLAAIPYQDAGGRELGDSLQDRPRRRHVLVMQVQLERSTIDDTSRFRVLEDRLEFRSVCQPIPGQPPVQRLLAEPVACQDQPADAPIP